MRKYILFLALALCREVVVGVAGGVCAHMWARDEARHWMQKAEAFYSPERHNVLSHLLSLSKPVNILLNKGWHIGKDFHMHAHTCMHTYPARAGGRILKSERVDKYIAWQSAFSDPQDCPSLISRGRWLGLCSQISQDIKTIFMLRQTGGMEHGRRVIIWRTGGVQLLRGKS